MSIPLPCCDDRCGLPFAVVDGDRLLIRSKHGSEKHVNALTLEELERLVVVLRASRSGRDLRAAG